MTDKITYLHSLLKDAWEAHEKYLDATRRLKEDGDDIKFMRTLEKIQSLKGIADLKFHEYKEACKAAGFPNKTIHDLWKEDDTY